MPTYKRSLQLQTRAVNEVRMIYSMAVTCKVTHSELTKQIMEVYNHTLKEAPQWAREYVRGYVACLLDRIQEEHMEFCYIIKGHRYSTRKDSPINYEKHHILPSQLSGQPNGFYWKDTDKLFY